MFRRFLSAILALAFIVSFTPALRAQKPKSGSGKIRAAVKPPASTPQYTYKTLVKVEIGRGADPGPTEIRQLDDNYLSPFVLTDGGDVVYYAFTAKGRGIYKNGATIAAPGKNFGGATIYQDETANPGPIRIGQSQYDHAPSLVAVSDRGSVLFQVFNRPAAMNSNPVGPIMVCDGNVVCDPYTEDRTKTHTDGVIGYGWDAPGFTTAGQYAVHVLYRTWTPHLDGDGKPSADPQGNPIYEPKDELKYLVNGTITDTKPKMAEAQRLDARMPVASTGILVKPLFRRVFGVEAGFDNDIGPEHTSVAAGLLVRRNKSGQIAIMLGTLKTGAWIPVFTRGAKPAQAVVVATPMNVKPEPTRVFFYIAYLNREHGKNERKYQSFPDAAATWKREIKAQYSFKPGKDKFIEAYARSANDFVSTWNDISQTTSQGNCVVIAGGLFTHSSLPMGSHGFVLETGLEFGGEPGVSPAGAGSTLTRDLIKALSKLNWSEKGKLELFGCNTGRIRELDWSPASVFASTQHIATTGEMGYADFSEDKDKYVPITDKTKNMYLRAYSRGRANTILLGYPDNGSRIPPVIFAP